MAGNPDAPETPYKIESTPLAAIRAKLPPISPEKMQEALTRLIGHPLESLKPDHPIYQLVAEVVRDVNHALKTTPLLRETYPNTTLALPKLLHIIKSDTVYASYDGIGDSLNLSEGIIKTLPTEQLKSIIAHELGHKLYQQKYGFLQAVFDRDSHAAYFSPGLRKACAAAGLTEQEINLLLPNAPAGKPITQNALSSSYIPVVANNLKTQNETLQASHPEIARTANDKASKAPECNEAIKTAWDRLPDSLTQIFHSNRIKRQGELAADQVSVLTYDHRKTAQAITSAAKAAREDKNFWSWQEIENDFTHPSLQTRVEEAGCQLKKNTDGSPEAVCLSEPTPSPLRGRAITAGHPAAQDKFPPRK